MGGIGKAIRAGLLALACGLLLSAAAAVDGDADFNIPAGEATSTLSAWSQISGLKIDAPEALTRGVATVAVKGRMDTHAALDAMIAGTTLQIVSDDGETIALATWRSQPQPQPGRPLPPPAPKPPKAPALPARLSGTFDYAAASTDDLIEALMGVDQSQEPGLLPTRISMGFIADDETFDVMNQMFNSPAPPVDPIMRELVRRGPIALPALLRHLSDTRPTRTSVWTPLDYGSQTFSEEYDARVRNRAADQCIYDDQPVCHSREFSGDYVLRVGDLCFSLVGQIVNRNLAAVQFLAGSPGFVVNSPIQRPGLAARARRDWGWVGASQLRASLQADLQDTIRWRTALPRLRLYFPDTYASLSGLSLVQRQAYEIEVQEARERRATVDTPYVPPPAPQPDDAKIAACADLAECLAILDREVAARDDYFEDDKAVAAKLAGFGDKAKQALLARLIDPTREWRSVALEILGCWPDLTDADLPALLLPLRFDGGSQVFDTLLTVGTPAALRLTMTESARLGIYRWAGYAYSDRGSSGMTMLLELLADPTTTVAAQNTVFEMDSSADIAAAPWAAIAANAAAPARQRLAALRGLEAMGSFGADAKAVILPLAKDSDKTLRAAATKALKSMEKDR